MIKQINFDMDGTIANLYGVDNWLPMLQAHDETPYKNASPLINMNILAKTLNKLIKNGWEINIISWLAKNSTIEYDNKVTKAKKKWLKTHLKSVEFSNIYIVPYGTPKEKIGKGILFDDEEQNRKNWQGIAYDEKNIIKILKGLM